MRQPDERLRQADDLAAEILAQVQELRQVLADARHLQAEEIESPELTQRRDRDD